MKGAATEIPKFWVANDASRYSHQQPASKPPGAEPYAVKVTQEYIESHYGRNLTLAELAARARLNRFSLVRAFRKKVGLPPHAFLTQVRISRAQKLLSEGWPIIRVAIETGFVDQSHFTNRFKRHVGITPGQFAEASRSYKTTAP